MKMKIISDSSPQMKKINSVEDTTCQNLNKYKYIIKSARMYQRNLKNWAMVSDPPKHEVPGPDRFSAVLYESFTEEIILYNPFGKIQMKGIFPYSFSKASIAWVERSHKDILKMEYPGTFSLTSESYQIGLNKI